MKLIDVTHTVKASEAPSPGARYMLDPVTEKRFWVEPDQTPAPAPVVPKRRKKKKDSEGDK